MYLVWQIRLLLVVGSLLSFFCMGYCVRHSRIRIENTIFWILISMLLVLMSVFPQIPYWMSNLLNIASPSNFVFLLMIFLLLVHQFFMTLKLSQMEIKMQELVQEIALKRKSEAENMEKEHSAGKDNDA